MTILVVGASGATGRLVVEQLLERGHTVKAIVRSTDTLVKLLDNDRLQILKASLLDLSDVELKTQVKDCQAVVSCLGHNITWKGMYGQPQKLVTGAVRRLCQAIQANKAESPVKYVLMNTSGNRNRDLNEPISFAEKLVVALLRLLLPPHVDNEQAADYLRTQIGQNNSEIEWIAVRPDGLTNEEAVSPYEIFASPVRSAIFNAGKTSRINVAHFMTELVSGNELWEKWKGQMPVIYNK